jgi:hypothetical protein
MASLTPGRATRAAPAPAPPARALPRFRTARRLAPWIAAAALAAGCSPEATRQRDGGLGADPGNRDWIAWGASNPRAADTTLWPGRDPAPVERLARGDEPPLPSPPTKTPGRPAERRAFENGAANPRAPEHR